MTKLAVAIAAIILCRYCQPTQGLSSSPQKLLRPIWPPGPISYPVGCCIHSSVAMIKKPDSHDPRNTRNAANQCATGPRRSSPNRKSPRKLDSRKNENTPSIASVCPITAPADLENLAQLVPN